jgi:hypothetical protein
MKLSSLVLTLYPMGPPIIPPTTMLSDIIMYCVHLLRTPLFGLVVSLRSISLLTSHPIPNLLLSLGSILPRVSQLSFSHAWPRPGILESVVRKLRLVNCSTEPIFIKKNDHICQARLVMSSSPPQTQVPS